jgi:hypothetical protein
MPQRPFLRFLLSLEALQVHLLCSVLIVVLSISLWTGEAQPDYGWGLLFTIVAWPVLIGLMWYSKRLDERMVVEHVVESITAPEKLRRKRVMWRRGSLVFLVSVAGALA